MSEDSLFQSTLRELFTRHIITTVIETGTFIGKGSTRTIANAFPANRPPQRYFTIEANLAFHLLARFNLRHWGFVKPLWGATIAQEEALQFIQKDEAIHHHERYPAVFIDDIQNPAGFYTAELEGKLGSHPLVNLTAWFGKTFLTRPEDLLHQLLLQWGDQRPLIVLDSAGGIGWLEYQTVRDTLGTKPYWLILDDIHHLKHFRSLTDVQNRPDFRVIEYSLEHGWLVAEHLASQS
ncbi:hypothetical protein GCM10027347_39160 [Larkinella harenae]